MIPYIGDFLPGKVVRHMWNSNAIAGESITRATNGTISVYKDGGTTQFTTNVTDTEDFDSLTGVHFVSIDTNNAAYGPGEYHVVLSAATIDGKTINAGLFSFSIANRSNATIIARGVSQGGGGATTSVLAAATAFADDILNGAILNVIAGTGAGQSASITDFVGATDTITHGTLATTLDNTSVYEIIAFGMVDNSQSVKLAAVGSATMTEAYAADGAAGTINQLLYEIKALLSEFAISGTTLTTKKVDGSTTANTYTLSDASNPVSITKAT